MSGTPRSRQERRRDAEQRLAQDVDLWVATASADGGPYLVQAWRDEAEVPGRDVLRDGRWLA
jgi:hypothetical protein